MIAGTNVHGYIGTGRKVCARWTMGNGQSHGVVADDVAYVGDDDVVGVVARLRAGTTCERGRELPPALVVVVGGNVHLSAFPL